MHQKCHCTSEKSYQDCCKRYHDGAQPENALALMRSRYSAYAAHQPYYIIHTTHPDNPHYKSDHVEWLMEIVAFCKNTKFSGLMIHEFRDGSQKAYVTFTARLEQNGADASFTEQSYFEKLDGKWLYRDGFHLKK